MHKAVQFCASPQVLIHCDAESRNPAHHDHMRVGDDQTITMVITWAATTAATRHPFCVHLTALALKCLTFECHCAQGTGRCIASQMGRVTVFTTSDLELGKWQFSSSTPMVTQVSVALL